MISGLPKYINKLASIVIFIHTQAHIHTVALTSVLYIKCYWLIQYINKYANFHFLFDCWKWEIFFPGVKWFYFLSVVYCIITQLYCCSLQPLTVAWIGEEGRMAGRQAEILNSNQN